MIGERKDRERARLKEKIEKELAELEKECWDNRIYHFREGGLWRPNPAQTKLLAAWDDPAKKVFSFCGANRIGKCNTFNTLIDTPAGYISVGKLFENNQSFDVYAWDGKKKVVAKASAPFKKEGLHQCYRVTMFDGRWVEPADHHRILLSDNRYVSTEALFYTYKQSLRESSSGSFLSVLPSGAVHLSERQSGYLDDYLVGCRLYGERPLSVRDSGQAFLPSQDDVQPSDDFWMRWDDRGSKRASSHRSGRALPSIGDVLRRNVGLFAESGFRIYDRILTFCYGLVPSFQRLSTVGAFGLQPDLSTVQRQSLFCGRSFERTYGSCEPPFSGVNGITSIIPIIECKEVYDFEVEKYHNYYAGGLVHHNTTIGVIIGLSVLFGEWPWSKEPIVFSHKEPRKVRYVGQGWESHVKTVVEPELKNLWPKFRKVETKKNNQGVEALWKDIATGSTLEIMSNNQESDTFEGWSGDLIIWDEPPKRDNRIASARGLIDRGGRELFVATLLKEAWIHREIIKARLADGSPDPSVFNIDADISVNIGYGLTQEGVDQFAKTLRKDEKAARLEGKPSYLGNLVLPTFNRDVHVVNRFKVPLNWVTDVSIDFHPSKPWAVLFVSTDQLSRKYATFAIHEKGNPKYIAEEIIRTAKQNDLFLNSITIDPLAKGDENAHIEAETVFNIMKKVFGSYDHRLETASKDKDNGIALINDLLMTENEMPALFFFRDLGIVIEQIEDWMYDPETFKPSKENDDFCEVLYRIILRNTKWFDPYNRYERLNKLPQADLGEVRIG